VGIGGRNALHPGALAVPRQLLRCERPGKAHPHCAVPRRKLCQHRRGDGKIVGILRQGEYLAQRLPAAGGARGGVTVRKGDIFAPKGHFQRGGHRQQMDAVLPGVQVGQHKARGLVCHTQQHGTPVGGFGQTDGHPALAFCGLPQTAAQLGAAEQHRAAHQRQQHQQGGAQRRPEGTPAAAFCVFHGSASFLCIKHDPTGDPLCRKAGMLYG